MRLPNEDGDHFFALIINFNLAQASQVFKCSDGSRNFVVEKGIEGSFFGFYKDSSNAPKRYECEKTRAGNNFKCTQNESVITVRRAYSGLMLVEVDFDASLALYCEN